MLSESARTPACTPVLLRDPTPQLSRQKKGLQNKCFIDRGEVLQLHQVHFILKTEVEFYFI